MTGSNHRFFKFPGTACAFLGAVLMAACVPASDPTLGAAPGGNVPQGFSETSGIPQQAVVSFKAFPIEGMNGRSAHLTFYEDMVSQTQLREAPEKICQHHHVRVASYEFVPTAQKPGAPATRKMRVVCSRH